MAKKKTADVAVTDVAATAETVETVAVAAIEPEAIYKVTLARAVPYGRMMLRPQDDVRLKGKVITGLGDAVVSYEKI